MGKKDFGKAVFVTCLWLFIILLFSCNESTPVRKCQKVIPLGKASYENKKWEAFFNEIEEIHFDFNGTDEQFASIVRLFITASGNYICYDARQQAIFLFNSERKFVKRIGKKGSGPGEYNFIAAIETNDTGDLMIYDPGMKRLTRYKAPEYIDFVVLDLAELPYPSSFIPTDKGGLILYSLYSPHLVQFVDNEGNLINQTFSVKDNDLRTFLSRFGTGNICATKDGFYMIYPGKFEFYFFDFNLQCIKAYTGTPSQFRPEIKGLPKHLSPYAFDKRYYEWWDSFLHIRDIYLINPDIILVQLYQSDKKMFSKQHFINLYSTNGITIVEGIPVPQHGRVVATKGTEIYVSTPPELKNDYLLSPKLFRYQLRKTYPQ